MKEEHKKVIENILFEFKKDSNGRMYTDNFARIIEDHNLRLLISRLIINDLGLVEKVNNQFLMLTKNGWDFTSFNDIESKELAKELKENLEVDLAKSNLEANKLNKQIAKQNVKNEKKNRITTWVNIGIGIINIGLLIWQILKADKS